MPHVHLLSTLARHHRIISPLFLVLAALIIRLVFLNQVSGLPTYDHPHMDEKYHVELAQRINSPEGYGSEPFYRAPLYPHLLAFITSFTGESLFTVRVLQSLLGALLPLLIFLLGLRLFSYRVAIVSAMIAVFYPTFLYFDSALLITSLMILLTTLLIWQLYRCQETTSLAPFVFAGLLLGIAGLARPNILLLGPVLFIWVWFILRPKLGTKAALVRYVLIGVSSLIVILPVTIRNYVVSNDIVFISWQGGFNFYLGNNSQATGWSATVPGIDQSWQGGYRDATTIAEAESGRTLKHSEVSDFWYDRAWQDIGRDPGGAIKLASKKLVLVFNG
jgi:4-amino-4-deoxy-L-arabinose transferase-like glycosyltransferase